MPMEIVAHTGRPDVEDEFGGIMRRPDVAVIAWEEMEIPGFLRSPHPRRRDRGRLLFQAGQRLGGQDARLPTEPFPTSARAGDAKGESGHGPLDLAATGQTGRKCRRRGGTGSALRRLHR
jgi:hypothetical protein